MEMIEPGQVRRIIIAFRDRLVCFDYDYFAAFCERYHTELVILNNDALSPEHEVVCNLLAVVTAFSVRLRG